MVSQSPKCCVVTGYRRETPGLPQHFSFVAVSEISVIRLFPVCLKLRPRSLNRDTGIEPRALSSTLIHPGSVLRLSLYPVPTQLPVLIPFYFYRPFLFYCPHLRVACITALPTYYPGFPTLLVQYPHLGISLSTLLVICLWFDFICFVLGSQTTGWTPLVLIAETKTVCFLRGGGV